MSKELSTIKEVVLSSVSKKELLCELAKEDRCPTNFRCDICELLDEDQNKLPEIMGETSCRTQRVGLLNSRVFTFCNAQGEPVSIMYYDGESGGLVTMARL